MKQIKTLLAALFIAMAGTAGAQTTNYVHITLDDNSVVHYSQDRIQSMIIDTETPDVIADYVEFTDGTNTVMVATMNLGATSVADGTSCYGDYYAWGATSTSTDHSQANAPYYVNGAYTKYTGSSDATLKAADDAVAVNMPGWHMPTRAEFQTLYAACGGTGTSKTPSSISNGDAYAKGIYWVTGAATSPVTIGGDAYKVNGVLFVQDATHHVFFPAAGGYNGTNLYHAGNRGYYWSSSLYTGNTNNAYYLHFYNDYVIPDNNYFRYSCFTVRPFKDAAPAPAPEPEEDFVTFTNGGNTVKVATMNLGATSVANGTASYGDYYAWGATEPFCTVDQSAGTVNAKYAGGYSHDNAPYRDKDASAYTKYTGTSDATLEAADDVVKVKKPGYHMPTQAEIQTLIDACGGSFSGSTTTYDTKGIYWVAGGDAAVEIGDDTYSVNGLLFVQDATHHVFFPAAGYVSDTDLRNAGGHGYYWSSSLRTDDTDNAYSLSFSSSGVDPDNLNRHVGFPVRPFKD